MEAYCDQEQYTKGSEQYRFIDTGGDLQLCGFNEGLNLGNQDHSTGMLMLSPEGIFHMEGTSGASENRHTNNESINLNFEICLFSRNDQHCSRWLKGHTFGGLGE
eukprot:1617545-Heterocapsa_arctica.AAC.1